MVEDITNKAIVLNEDGTISQAYGVSVGSEVTYIIKQEYKYGHNKGDEIKVIVKKINKLKDETITFSVLEVGKKIPIFYIYPEDIKEIKEKYFPTEPKSDKKDDSKGKGKNKEKRDDGDGGDSGDSPEPEQVKPPRTRGVGWIQPLIALIVTALLLILLKFTRVIGNVETWVILLIIIGVNLVLAKFTEKLEMKYKEEQEKRKNLGIKGLLSFDLETIIAVSLILIGFGLFEDTLFMTIIGTNELFSLLIIALLFFFRYQIADGLRLIYHKIFQNILQKAKTGEKGAWNGLAAFFHKGIILTILKLGLSWAITYMVLFRFLQEYLLGFIIITAILAFVIWQEWGLIAFLPLIIYVVGILSNFTTKGLILPYLIIIGCIKLIFDLFHAFKKTGIKINPKIGIPIFLLILIGVATFFAIDFIKNKQPLYGESGNIMESTSKWSIITNWNNFFQANFALLTQDSMETKVNTEDYTYITFSNIYGQNNVGLGSSNEIIMDLSVDSTSEIKEYNATISCKLYDRSNKLLANGLIYPKENITLTFIPQTIRCIIPGGSLSKVGNYKVKFYVNVKNMTTTAILSNQFVDGKYLTNKLKNIALKNNLRFSTESEYLKTIAFAFPYLITEKPVSITTDGPITLALKSGNMPINPYPYEDSNNNLKIGLMNNDNGKLSRIEYLKFYLPREFELTATNSEEGKGSSIQLKEKENFENYNMYQVKDESKEYLVSVLSAIKNLASGSYYAGSTNLLGASNGIIRTFFYESKNPNLELNKYLETQKNFIAEIKYDYKSEKEFLFKVIRDDMLGGTTIETSDGLIIHKLEGFLENIGESRSEDKINLIVLHHTASAKGADVTTIINILNNRGLSVQYVVEQDGDIYQLTNPDIIAWHAGLSEPKNTYNYGCSVNDRSIGIEMINKGDGTDSFEEQYESVRKLLAYLTNKYSNLKYDDSHIMAHYQLNSNKPDPAKNFDWSKIGLPNHPLISKYQGSNACNINPTTCEISSCST